MTSENVIEVGDASWEKIVEKSKKPVMVMFYTLTCPYCKQMEPHFEEYAKEFKEKVKFVRVNAADNPFVAERYSIMGTPTFKFFCNGHSIKELSGAMYPALLKKAVEEGLQHGPECEKNTTWIDPGITGYA